MKIYCYLFIFIFEQFIAYIYFHNKFENRKSLRFISLLFSLSFFVQFFVNMFGIPELNLITFLMCNFIVVYLSFYASIKQVFFNVLLLEGIMITSELATMHFTTVLLNVDLHDYTSDDAIMILETIATKTLYFAIAYIASKVSIKEKGKIHYKDISYLLFFLPLSSIGTIISFTYLSINYEIEQFTKLFFAIISMILLVVNIIVFLVHESMVNTLEKNTELILEKQKNEINSEYYDELKKQYDLSNILIHDIKKCLLNIRELSTIKDNKKIIDYIDSIYEGYEIKSLKQYSNNKLVNVIVSRYSQLCANDNIYFSVDIRDVNFSFISDSDLTALLDNLLENAYEASKNVEYKEICLSIDYYNEKYLLIKLVNSSIESPVLNGNSIVSSKIDKEIHGMGTKKIYKIAKKYNGNVKYNYRKSESLFISTILLKVC